MEPQKPPITSPDELMAAAIGEDWTTVDAAIAAGVADQDDFLRLAKGHLDDPNGDVRDLAVSIYEATTRDPSETTKQKLETMMATDENPYAQFRSAFALFRHGSRSATVIAKINAALEDEDVAEIAQRYLDQLEQEGKK